MEQLIIASSSDVSDQNLQNMINSDQSEQLNNNQLKRKRRKNSPSKNEKWGQMFDELEKYCSEFGHSNMPVNYKVSHNGKILNVGAWVAAQRQQKRMNLLSEERCLKFQKLIDEGKFKWNYLIDMIEERWEKIFQVLLEYCDAHGHCNIPKKYEIIIEDGSVLRLGNWLNDQVLFLYLFIPSMFYLKSRNPI